MTERTVSGPPLQVLVVCSANITRSPLATAMLRAALPAPGLVIESAGVEAVPDQRAAGSAARLALERGLDLGAHRSRQVSDEMLREAELVLAMSERLRDHCAGRVPGAGPRTFTLREFVRLLGEVPVEAGPSTTVDRLRWLRDRAHEARPRTVRPQEPEDLEDPTGRGPRAWVRLGTDLDELIGRIHRAVTSSG